MHVLYCHFNTHGVNRWMKWMSLTTMQSRYEGDGVRRLDHIELLAHQLPVCVVDEHQNACTHSSSAISISALSTVSRLSTIHGNNSLIVHSADSPNLLSVTFIYKYYVLLYNNTLTITNRFGSSTLCSFCFPTYNSAPPLKCNATLVHADATSAADILLLLLWLWHTHVQWKWILDALLIYTIIIVVVYIICTYIILLLFTL